MLTIRMSRGGRKNSPSFAIVLTDSRKSRDGGYLERLGNYDPRADKVLFNLKATRIQELVKGGATVSDTVRTLLAKEKIAL